MTLIVPGLLPLLQDNGGMPVAPAILPLVKAPLNLITDTSIWTFRVCIFVAFAISKVRRWRRHPGNAGGVIRDRQKRRAVFFAIPDSRERLPG
jgi:hypothetical protein